MIKVGDLVTWQLKPRKTLMPMAVRGATVVALGETKDGKPAAMIKVGTYGEFGVLIEDLRVESNHED